MRVELGWCSKAGNMAIQLTATPETRPSKISVSVGFISAFEPCLRYLDSICGFSLFVLSPCSDCLLVSWFQPGFWTLPFGLSFSVPLPRLDGLPGFWILPAFWIMLSACPFLIKACAVCNWTVGACWHLKPFPRYPSWHVLGVAVKEERPAFKSPDPVLLRQMFLQVHAKKDQ